MAPCHSSRRLHSALLILAGVLACLPSRAAPQASVDMSAQLVLTVDLPNAAGEYTKSVLTDITNAGGIVGGFTFPSHGLHEPAIVLTLPGTVTAFTCGPTVSWTTVQAMNSHGAQVGWCYTRTNDQESVQGFYRSESGRITLLTYPGARLTEAAGVNDAHLVVGSYVDAQGNGHGFTWQRSTGQYTSLDAPFAGAVYTVPMSINNLGHIVGLYHAPLGDTHGFLVRQGQWTSIDAPGAQTTILADINDLGQIIGIMNSPSVGSESFLLENGAFRILALPFPHIGFTDVSGINLRGQVIGHFQQDFPQRDPDAEPVPSVEHGFVAMVSALLAPPAGTPVVQGATGARARVMTKEVRPTRTLMVSGCPDEPTPAGMVRPLKLAQRWALCRR